MRRFHLFRRNDTSGMTGTGVVAEGTQFADGKCAVRWLTRPAATNVYDSFRDVQRIHGHGGKTLICWIDRFQPGVHPRFKQRAMSYERLEPLDGLPIEAARPGYGVVELPELDDPLPQGVTTTDAD